MKKLKSIPEYFLLIVLCSNFITSCSHDPVTPPPTDPKYQYDSARFSWEVDTLYEDGYRAGLWAADNNELFIPNVFTNTIVHIKKGIKTFIQYPNDNVAGAVYGDDDNNGFRIGAILVDTIFQPLFQKWNGINFVDINNPQNLDKSFSYWTVLIKNKNEMWIGLTDGTVLKYDGISFIHYPLTNPDLVITRFFYDEFNRLKFLAYDPHYELDRIEYFIYELINNEWVIIYTDFDTDLNGPLRYDIVGKQVAPIGLHEIYELIGNSPIPRINVPVYSFYMFLSGSSYSNVLIAATEVFPGCNASLFHWNGNKWSLELCGYYVINANVSINNEIFYVVSYNPDLETTYVIRSFKKLNSKIKN